jgi:putative ABC transport system substrate-binding protein
VIRRREVIAMLGGAAAVSPFVARARQKLPVVGVLTGGLSNGDTASSPTFLAGLQEAGFVDGQSVTIDIRFAEGHYERLPALAAGLVARKVDVIAASTVPAALAAKNATATIPVAFSLGADPVKLGLVASLSRPGGNVTGTTFLINELTAKQLELLRDLIPKATTVGLLVNPDNETTAAETRDAEAAARALGLTLRVERASAPSEFETAFVAFASQRVDAFVMAADGYFTSEAHRIVGLSARYAIPAVYTQPAFVTAGGLASYGGNPDEALHQLGVYVGRILKGAKPADLPIFETTKFELVINLKTAKALGLTVSREMLLRADEVIE